MDDLNKLSPVPWVTVSSRDLFPAVVASGICTVAIDFENETDAAFVCLARNAFDVMMRRGWYVGRYPANKKWFVSFHSPKFDTILSREKCGYKHYHSDPFTALVEADKWYAANVEGKS